MKGSWGLNCVWTVLYMTWRYRMGVIRCRQLTLYALGDMDTDLHCGCIPNKEVNRQGWEICLSFLNKLVIPRSCATQLPGQASWKTIPSRQDRNKRCYITLKVLCEYISTYSAAILYIYDLIKLSLVRRIIRFDGSAFGAGSSQNVVCPVKGVEWQPCDWTRPWFSRVIRTAPNTRRPWKMNWVPWTPCRRLAAMAILLFCHHGKHLGCHERQACR